MSQNILKLDADKTDFLVMGTQQLSEVSYLFLIQYSVTYSFSLLYSQLLPYSKTGLKGLIFLMMTHKLTIQSVDSPRKVMYVKSTKRFITKSKISLML